MSPGADDRPWDAVFLDRDGTLNVAPPAGQYILRPDDLVLLPGAAHAVARLNAADIPVFVVTNQRGVALGLITRDGLDAVNARLMDLLAEHRAVLVGIHVCPHADGSCDCRKPRDGLLRRVLEARPDLRPRRCAVVGDNWSDLRAGEPLGLFRVLLATTPAPPAFDESVMPSADRLAPDLAGAVDLLLSFVDNPADRQ